MGHVAEALGSTSCSRVRLCRILAVHSLCKPQLMTTGSRPWPPCLPRSGSPEATLSAHRLSIHGCECITVKSGTLCPCDLFCAWAPRTTRLAGPQKCCWGLGQGSWCLPKGLRSAPCPHVCALVTRALGPGWSPPWVCQLWDHGHSQPASPGEGTEAPGSALMGGGGWVGVLCSRVGLVLGGGLRPCWAGGRRSFAVRLALHSPIPVPTGATDSSWL